MGRVWQHCNDVILRGLPLYTVVKLERGRNSWKDIRTVCQVDVLYALRSTHPICIIYFYREYIVRNKNVLFIALQVFNKCNL